MPRHSDTIAALATAPGAAAIGVVRISGPDTGRVVAALAGGSPPPPRRARHLDYRSVAGTLIDDVLLTFFAAPHSYTGEDAAEISCHGNPFIARKLLEDLFARGCRAAQPGEFTQRAFLNGRMDLSQAEAVMDLIYARGERSLAAAQQQLRGALTQRMAGLVDRLLGALARIEAYIDFPEEDLPPEDSRNIATELQQLEADTMALLQTSEYGELLRAGIKAVIIGAPNVGKSSLLNRLVGHERALVSPEPGTTRDFIEESVLVGGYEIRLIDTAGLNPAPAPLERRGMDKTMERAAAADLFLVVVDVSLAAAADLEPAIRARLGPDNSVLVLNKADLTTAAPALPAWASHLPRVSVSALTGLGFEQLIETVQRLVVARAGEHADESVAVSARHAQALREALVALKAAMAKLKHAEPAELLASDLRAVLAAYGEITGKVDNEQMLDRLFASFCIGK